MPDIAQLTFQLDHPDVPTQQEAADALVALGAEHLDAIVANIAFATPRARRALIGVIARIGTPAAMINLMRFVWDRRGSIEDSDARGLAMKGIAKLARPEDGARVLSFLMDVAEDHDPFVRAWTAQTLAALGDPRARAFLKQMLNDESEIVRERAQAGLEQLLDGTSDALISQVDDTELLAKLRTATGAHQAYWFNELKARPNALELAARMVREGGKGAGVWAKLSVGVR
ncbi:MAG: HEAT repeat domain-containing protein [bacterium]